MPFIRILGVRFPGVHVRTDSPTLESDEYSIFLNEVPIVRGKIMENALLTNETPDNLRRYNIPFTTTKNNYRAALGLGRQQVPRDPSKSRHQVLETPRCDDPPPLLFLSPACRRFHRHSRSARHFGVHRKVVPRSVKEVTRLVPLQKLTEIFKTARPRADLDQRPAHDSRERSAEWAQTEKDTVLLTEYVRSSLKRYISYKYSQGQSVLSVYLLDPEIEDMVRGAIKQTSAGSYLALDPDSVQLILHCDAHNHRADPRRRTAAGAIDGDRRAPFCAQADRRGISRHGRRLLSGNRPRDPNPASGPGSTFIKVN